MKTLRLQTSGNGPFKDVEPLLVKLPKAVHDIQIVFPGASPGGEPIYSEAGFPPLRFMHIKKADLFNLLLNLKPLEARRMVDYLVSYKEIKTKKPNPKFLQFMSVVEIYFNSTTYKLALKKSK